MTSRPAARLRWGPACRRACATSEGGGEQSAGRLQSGAGRAAGGWSWGLRLVVGLGKRVSFLRGGFPNPVGPVSSWPVGCRLRSPVGQSDRKPACRSVGGAGVSPTKVGACRSREAGRMGMHWDSAGCSRQRQGPRSAQQPSPVQRSARLGGPDWAPGLTGRPEMRSLYRYRMGKLRPQSMPGFPAARGLRQGAASLSVDNGEG